MALLDAVKKNESGGDYRAQNTTSTASGAYGFINATWNDLATKAGYGAYTDYSAGTTPGQGIAKNAPPAVQDAVATYAAKNYDPNSSYLWKASAPPGGYTNDLGTTSYTKDGITLDFQDPAVSVTGGSYTGAGGYSSYTYDAGPGSDSNFGANGEYGVAQTLPEGTTSLNPADYIWGGITSGGTDTAKLPNALPGGSASSTWWQNLLTNIQDLSIRGGLGMLALVLIAAAAFAFTFGHGSLKEAAANTAKTAARVIK